MRTYSSSMYHVPSFERPFKTCIQQHGFSPQTPSQRSFPHCIQSRTMTRKTGHLFLHRSIPILFCGLLGLFFVDPDSRSRILSSKAASSWKLPNHKRVIYTFLESKPDTNDRIDSELLQWQMAWKAAGWDPRILTLEDALKHTDFSMFEKALSSIMPFGYRDEKMDYYRWLAMAVDGGGWFADLNVFPLWPLNDLHQAFPIVMDEEKFTVHCGSNQNPTPCLMNGSAEEWNRMSMHLLESVDRHGRKMKAVDIDDDSKDPDEKLQQMVWTNKLALQDVMSYGNPKGRPVAAFAARVLASSQAHDLISTNSAPLRRDTCTLNRSRIAVQWTAGSSSLTFFKELSRPLHSAQEWLQRWKVDCGSKTAAEERLRRLGHRATTRQQPETKILKKDDLTRIVLAHGESKWKIPEEYQIEAGPKPPEKGAGHEPSHDQVARTLVRQRKVTIDQKT